MCAAMPFGQPLSLSTSLTGSASLSKVPYTGWQSVADIMCRLDWCIAKTAFGVAGVIRVTRMPDLVRRPWWVGEPRRATDATQDC